MSKRKPRGLAHQLPKMRATLGWVRPGGDHAEVKASFMMSAWRANMYEIGEQGVPLGVIDQQCASGQLVEARNNMVQYFLDESDVEWLWVVDSDMGFAMDTCSQLIGSADPVERPVVGALCFGLRLKETDEELYTNRFLVYPTIYIWKEAVNDDGDVTDVGFSPMLDYERDALIECDATGAACFVVHRTVLEKMRAEFGHIWFNRLSHPAGKTFGEDLSFFARMRQLGIPLYVNTAIRTMHDKGGVCVDQEWFDMVRPHQNFG